MTEKVFKGTEKIISVVILLFIHLMSSIIKVPVPVQLILNSLATIYLGCVSSIKLTKRMNVKSGEKDKKEESKEKEEEKQEVVTAKDAYLFPVYGSFVLFSLYLIFKFLDKKLISLVFTFYFSMLGQFCLMMFIEGPLGRYFPNLKERTILKYEFNLKSFLFFYNKEVKIDINMLNMSSFSIAVLPTFLYLLTKHWILNNLFGIMFSIAGIDSLVLPNFKVGFILLWGLFFYDIFWVYGTDVMVTVAKSLDAPIKLQFPLDLTAVPAKFSMLGLGDLVIPGVFIALCLKFDVDYHLIKFKNQINVKTPFFKWCFIGYIIGIITTFAVMVIFKHAQPALLFLVPACTFSILLLALKNGMIKELFSYEENPEVCEKKNENSEKAKNK